MEEFGGGKAVACACFLAAYIVVYVAIGSFDNAFDAVHLTDEIARHDAEWSLSASFGAFVIVGLVLLWLFGASSYFGGFVIGALSALAAGGFHVMPYATTWLPIALIVGLAGGAVLLVAGKRRPVASALFSIEVALAAVQVAFVIQNAFIQSV